MIGVCPRRPRPPSSRMVFSGGATLSAPPFAPQSAVDNFPRKGGQTMACERAGLLRMVTARAWRGRSTDRKPRIETEVDWKCVGSFASDPFLFSGIVDTRVTSSGALRFQNLGSFNNHEAERSPGKYVVDNPHLKRVLRNTFLRKGCMNFGDTLLGDNPTSSTHRSAIKCI